DRKMIGISAQSGFWLMRRQTSKPSISGINRSSRMRLGRRTAIRLRAWAPLVAGMISRPSLTRAEPTTRMLISWSSTTRRQGVEPVGAGGSNRRLVCMGVVGARVFEGLDQLRKGGQFPFEVCDGKGVGITGQSLPVGDEVFATRGLPEIAQFA